MPVGTCVSCTKETTFACQACRESQPEQMTFCCSNKQCLTHPNFVDHVTSAVHKVEGKRSEALKLKESESKRKRYLESDSSSLSSSSSSSSDYGGETWSDEDLPPVQKIILDPVEMYEDADSMDFWVSKFCLALRTRMEESFSDLEVKVWYRKWYPYHPNAVIFFALQKIVWNYGIYFVSSNGKKSYDLIQDVEMKRALLSERSTLLAFRIFDSSAPYFAKIKSLIFDLTRANDVSEGIPFLVNITAVNSFLVHTTNRASNELGQSITLNQATWQKLVQYFDAGLFERITGEYIVLPIVKVVLKPSSGMQIPPPEQYELHHR